MSLKAGLGGDLINFVICVVVFFIIGYVVAYAMIGKFHFATPGRLGNYTDETAPEDGDQTEGSSTAGTGTKKGNSQAAVSYTHLGRLLLPGSLTVHRTRRQSPFLRLPLWCGR